MSTSRKFIITLPADLAKLVTNAVSDGYYTNVGEVIRDALRDWKIKQSLNERSSTNIEEALIEPVDFNMYIEDELYLDAVEFVTITRKVSISGIQRQFKIGYNRAASIIETMEARGVITPAELNGSRSVLLPPPLGN